MAWTAFPSRTLRTARRTPCGEGMSACFERPVVSILLTGSTGRNDLKRTASVTTMETKFVISPHIAEFFCFLTSPAYAAPCTIWLQPKLQPRNLPPAFHLALLSCFLTATFSTIYHASLTKITSSLDAGQAVVTFWLVALLLAQQRSLALHLSVWLLIAGIYVWNWRKTAVLSIGLTSLVVPYSMYILCTKSEGWAALAFFCGVVCFLLDRFKIAPLHAAWHVLGRCNAGGSIAGCHCHVGTMGGCGAADQHQKKGKKDAALPTGIMPADKAGAWADARGNLPVSYTCYRCCLLAIKLQ